MANAGDVLFGPADAKLKARVKSLFITINEPVNTWLVYLVHPNLDMEPHLRNRIFCILVNSMAEAASEAENRLLALDREAAQLALTGVRKHLVFARAYCDGVAHLLSALSDDELYALHRWRNMLTHGRLSTATQERFTVYQIRNGQVVTRKVDRATYLDGTIKTVRSYGGLEAFLTTMRSRFSEKVSFFWHLALSMRLPTFIPAVAQEIDEGREDLVVVVLADDSFEKTHALFEQRGDPLYSLKTVRDVFLEQGEPRVWDPVFR